MNLKDEKFQSVNGDTENSLVCTMNDIDPNYITRPDNQVMVKNLFERKGIDLNIKNKEIKKVLIGASVVITSNTLPRLSRSDHEKKKLKDKIKEIR